jgi:hypothetical protein
MILFLPYVQRSGSRPHVFVTPAEFPPSSYIYYKPYDV